MKSASLLASMSCSSNSAMTGNTSTASFILLSPCPQRLVLASLDVIFLLIFFIFIIRNLFSKFNSGNDATINEPLVIKTRGSVETNLWFKLSLLVFTVSAILAIILSVLGFTNNTQVSWKLIDGTCWLIQSISFIVIVVLILQEKRLQYATHSISLRVFWMLNFIAIALIASSSITRLVSGDPLSVSDVILFVSLLFSGFLLIASLKGSTGILLTPETNPNELDKHVSGWATASIVSKTFWFWMNPLLKKGYKTVLTLDDIPTLSPEHHAEKISLVFEQNWPKPNENPKHPVRTTLIRCFWKHILFTGFLATMKLAVGYVGPL